MAWREAGAELLDKIGPAIIMTHSAGGPFGLLVAASGLVLLIRAGRRAYRYATAGRTKSPSLAA